MVWIVDQPSTQTELASQFRELMNAPTILQIPGAHDAMAGLVAKKLDFPPFTYRAQPLQQALGCLI